MIRFYGNEGLYDYEYKMKYFLIMMWLCMTSDYRMII